MTEVTLTIGSEEFTGWTRINIVRGIEQLAGTFELECADRWALKGQQTPLLEGEACTIKVGDQIVITGFIDASNPSYDAEEHTLTISGRDATGDLVDCAAIVPGMGHLNRNLFQIAQSLCKPYGVNVSVDPGVQVGPAFQTQQIQVGEAVWEALSRLAVIRGLLLVSDGMGGLRITKAGTTRASTMLKREVNILAGEATHSVAQRFHEYRALSQGIEFSGDNIQQTQSVLGRGYDNDPAVRSARVTIVDGVNPLDGGMAKKIAQWTADVRRAQGERAGITVRGWLDGDALWQHNEIVSVDDDWLRFQGDYLIACCTYSLSKNQGEITRLDIVPPDAYLGLARKETPNYDFGLFSLKNNPPSAGPGE